MIYFWLVIFFMFGASLGSFLAVIASRYNTGLVFIKGHSFCFSCNTKLKNKDLFPIFSFLFLRGKCRYCNSKIPKETLMTEFVMGLLSVLAAFKSGILAFNFFLIPITSYLLLLAIFAIIVLISLYDLKHFIIPDSFLFILFSLSYFYLAITHNSYFLVNFFVTGFILALPFFLIFLLSRGHWLGFGDVKYIFVIGFMLGFVRGVSAIILSFWLGAIVSVILLFLKRFKKYLNLSYLQNNFTIKSEIPFGPFLSIGAVISLLIEFDFFNLKYWFDAF